MAITKEVVVDQIEATANHTIQIRLKKNLVENGNVLSSAYHRTVLTPGAPLAAQIAAVNDDLAQSINGGPWPAVKDVKRIEAIVKAEHTPEVVKEWTEQHNPAPKPKNKWATRYRTTPKKVRGK